MANPFVLSGLLSAWLVGPLYGINVVMVVVIMRKLWRIRASLASRSLMLIAALLISSCTAHAFIYLADLIDGMTSAFAVANGSNASEWANAYFENATRPKVLGCFFLYIFNSFCNNLFVTWRVYAIWRRQRYYFAAFLITLILSSVTVNGVCGHLLSRDKAKEGFNDPTAKGLFTAGWILLLIMQISGALLIGWHTMVTPKVVAVGDVETKRNIFRTLFYAFIESGCLALCTELVMVALLYHNWAAALVFIAVLGQITGISTLSIILRELYKAEIDSSNGFVNVTSALAAMQMQDLSHRRAQRSIGPSDVGEGRENTVMVDIETSRHEDLDVEKPTSRKFRSHAVDKIVLSDIEAPPSV